MRSNTNFWTTVIASLLFIIIFSVSAQAQTTVVAPQEVYVDSCDSITYTIDTSNPTLEAQRVFVSLADTRAAEWVVFDPQDYLLIPGEQQQVTVHIRVPCRQEGRFDLKFEVSDGVDVYDIKQTLIVSRPNNIGVVPYQNYVTSCPCLPQTQTFTVENTAGVADVYRLAVKGSDHVQVIPDAKILFPGQRQEFTVLINTPCQLYGKHNFDITVATDNSGFKATLPFKYDIEACYDYTFGTPQQVTACLDERTTFYVNLTNDMHFTNEFSFKGLPEWVEVPQDSVFLNAGQRAIVPISIVPLSEDLGRFEALDTIQVAVKEKYARQTVNIELPVLTDVCYDVNVSGIDEEVFACPGRTTYPVQITNWGTSDQTFLLDLEGPVNMFLEEGSVQIDAGQSAFVNLVVDIEDELADISEQRANIFVQAADAPLVYQQIDFTLNEIPNRECYQVDITPTRFSLADGQPVVINVTHNGYKASNYSVVTNNTFGVSVSRSDIELTPGQTTSIPLGVNTTETDFTVPIAVGNEKSAYQFDVFFGERSIWLWVIIILIILLLLIAIVVLLALLASRDKDSKQTKIEEHTQDKINAKKSTTKELKEPKKKKSEEPPEDDIEEMTRSKNNWWWILIILLLLALLFVGFFFGPQDSQSGLGDNTTNATGNESINQTINDTLPPVEDVAPPVDNTTNISQNQTTTEEQTGSSSLWARFWWWITHLGASDDGADTQTPVNETQGNESADNESEQTSEQTLQDVVVPVFDPKDEEIQKLNETVTQLNELLEEQQQIILNQNTVIENLSTVRGPLTQRQVDILLLADTLDRIDSGFNSELLYQVIPESGNLTIDLGDLFSDPDGEALTYTALEPEDLLFEINDSQLTMSAQDDFIGLTYTVFYAQDQTGAVATSPIINVLVVPENVHQQAEEIRSSINTTAIDALIDELYVPQTTGVIAYDRGAMIWAALGLSIFIFVVVLLIFWLAEIGQRPPKKSQLKQKQSESRFK